MPTKTTTKKSSRSQNTTLNLSLPLSLKKKAVAQAKAQDFGTTSDYVQHLLREDAKKAQAIRELNAYLQKGIDSGPPIEYTSDELRAMMNKVIEKAA